MLRPCTLLRWAGAGAQHPSSSSGSSRDGRASCWPLIWKRQLVGCGYPHKPGVSHPQRSSGGRAHGRWPRINGTPARSRPVLGTKRCAEAFPPGDPQSGGSGRSLGGADCRPGRAPTGHAVLLPGRVPCAIHAWVARAPRPAVTSTRPACGRNVKADAGPVLLPDLTFVG
jgi:hypothetical protein